MQPFSDELWQQSSGRVGKTENNVTKPVPESLEDLKKQVLGGRGDVKSI